MDASRSHTSHEQNDAIEPNILKTDNIVRAHNYTLN